jgi:hypothetical protein
MSLGEGEGNRKWREKMKTGKHTSHYMAPNLHVFHILILKTGRA